MIDRLLNEPILVARAIHILSAVVLLGFGLGTGYCARLAWGTRDADLVAGLGPIITRGEMAIFSLFWLSLVFSGLWLVHQLALKLATPWIVAGAVSLGIASFCWLMGLSQQLRAQSLADVARRHRKPLGRDFANASGRWFLFSTIGWLALFAGLLAMIGGAHQP